MIQCRLQDVPWEGLRRVKVPLFVLGLVAFLLGTAPSVGWAGATPQSSGLLGLLIEGESAFSDREIFGDFQGGAFGFSSKGLPSQCAAARSSPGEVRVLFIFSKTEPIRLQVMGSRPEVFSGECILNLASRIREAQIEGMTLIESNLNRMRAGGRLYLEFYIEGPKLTAQIQDLMRAIPSASGWSRARLWPWVLLVGALVIAIYIFQWMIQKRSRSNVG